KYAVAFFNAVSVGTPVTVYGRTPTGRYMGQLRPRFPWGPAQFRDPRFNPRSHPPPRPWGVKELPPKSRQPERHNPINEVAIVTVQGRCSAGLSTLLALAVLGPRERSTKSARML